MGAHARVQCAWAGEHGRAQVMLHDKDCSNGILDQMPLSQLKAQL